jgi:hypothetical protein
VVFFSIIKSLFFGGGLVFRSPYKQGFFFPPNSLSRSNREYPQH